MKKTIINLSLAAILATGVLVTSSSNKVQADTRQKHEVVLIGYDVALGKIIEDPPWGSHAEFLGLVLKTSTVTEGSPKFEDGSNLAQVLASYFDAGFKLQTDRIYSQLVLIKK